MSVFRYFPGGAQVPESVAVNVRNRSHALIVDVVIADPGRTDGVLLALGSALGGWSLHILDGRIRYVHNLYGKERHTVESARGDRGRARTTIEFVFTKDDGLGGIGVLSCDGRQVGGRTIGGSRRPDSTASEPGSPAATSGDPPSARAIRRRSRSPGRSAARRCETRGPVVRDPLAELEAILAEQ